MLPLPGQKDRWARAQAAFVTWRKETGGLAPKPLSWRGGRRPVGSRPSRFCSRSLTDNADPFRVIRAFRGPPDASKTSVPPRLREIPTARHPRQPHIARVDYDYEHRCAEHEHDAIPFPWSSVSFRGPTPARHSPLRLCAFARNTRRVPFPTKPSRSSSLRVKPPARHPPRPPIP